MHEELSYHDGPGPAKRLQFEHGVVSADIAALIAAAVPVPADQEAAARAPLPEGAPIWPWSAQSFQERLLQAQRLLTERSQGGNGLVPRPGSDLPSR